MIDGIVALVGSSPETRLAINGIPVPDFNFTMDPEALRVLLDRTEVPLTIIQFETSSSALVPASAVEDLRESDDPARAYFGDASAIWVEWWTQVFGEEGFHPWDANTVWYLLHPEAYMTHPAGYQIRVGAPSPLPTDESSSKFSPSFTSTRTVTACHGYVDDQARNDFVDAVMAAVRTRQ